MSSPSSSYEPPMPVAALRKSIGQVLQTMRARNVRWSDEEFLDELVAQRVVEREELPRHRELLLALTRDALHDPASIESEEMNELASPRDRRRGATTGKGNDEDDDEAQEFNDDDLPVLSQLFPAVLSSESEETKMRATVPLSMSQAIVVDDDDDDVAVGVGSKSANSNRQQEELEELMEVYDEAPSQRRGDSASAPKKLKTKEKKPGKPVGNRVDAMWPIGVAIPVCTRCRVKRYNRLCKAEMCQSCCLERQTRAAVADCAEHKVRERAPKTLEWYCGSCKALVSLARGAFGCKSRLCMRCCFAGRALGQANNANRCHYHENLPFVLRSEVGGDFPFLHSYVSEKHVLLASALWNSFTSGDFKAAYRILEQLVSEQRPKTHTHQRPLDTIEVFAYAIGFVQQLREFNPGVSGPELMFRNLYEQALHSLTRSAKSTDRVALKKARDRAVGDLRLVVANWQLELLRQRSEHSDRLLDLSSIIARDGTAGSRYLDALVTEFMGDRERAAVKYMQIVRDEAAEDLVGAFVPAVAGYSRCIEFSGTEWADFIAGLNDKFPNNLYFALLKRVVFPDDLESHTRVLALGPNMTRSILWLIERRVEYPQEALQAIMRYLMFNQLADEVWWERLLGLLKEVIAARKVSLKEPFVVAFVEEMFSVVKVPLRGAKAQCMRVFYMHRERHKIVNREYRRQKGLISYQQQAKQYPSMRGAKSFLSRTFDDEGLKL